MSTIAESVAAALAAHPRMPSVANDGPVTVEGIGGAPTVEEIRQRSRRTPIVFVGVDGFGTPTPDEKKRKETPCKVVLLVAAQGPHVTKGASISRHEKCELIVTRILSILLHWPNEVSSPTETAPNWHVGVLESRPENVQAVNRYDAGINKEIGLAVWTISYEANYSHPRAAEGDFNDWDLFHAEFPKDEFPGAVVDGDDETTTLEKDMSP